MTNAIKNSCGNKRGCTVVIVLPYDRRPGPVLSKVHGTKHDLSEVLPLADFSLDKEPAQKEPLEKMAA